MQDGSHRAIIAAFVANLAIAIAKFVGFGLTGSASMLAEAVHSVADTSNQGLLILGGRRARRPATPHHPFGHGRERYFWAFVVALVIFSLGSLFALYEAEEKLRHPHEIESAAVAMTILGVAVGFEALSLRTAVRESRSFKGSSTWWTFIRRSKSPELPVVLLEDLGALVGLVFAFAGVAVAEATGNPRFDAVGSLAIGLLLAAIAVTLIVEMKSLLIGESADPGEEARLYRAIESHRSVRRVLHMRTQHLGPEELLVAVKVELDHGLDVPGVAAAIDGIETAMREAVPAARMIYVEPDLHRER
ncbi:MAG: cation diffusion facilitator family transporter [Actinobacteria bacterium]|nr:cation diffusion facilitator family transporter [Actinomycetota bacterium]